MYYWMRSENWLLKFGCKICTEGTNGGIFASLNCSMYLKSTWLFMKVSNRFKWITIWYNYEHVWKQLLKTTAFLLPKEYFPLRKIIFIWNCSVLSYWPLSMAAFCTQEVSNLRDSFLIQWHDRIDMMNLIPRRPVGLTFIRNNSRWCAISSSIHWHRSSISKTVVHSQELILVFKNDTGVGLQAVMFPAFRRHL